MLGRNFEREIRQQPAVWRRLAHGNAGERLARALRQSQAVLVGSGSSLHAAELGALALRRRGLRADALAATEARLDHRAYEGATVVAISQSGRSVDVLNALDVLRPRRLIAVTNSYPSLLAERAEIVIDVAAGIESAIPASKSVSATIAVLLRAASILSGSDARDAATLIEAADAVDAWFESPGFLELVDVATSIARCRNVIFLGSDYGYPIAREAALKMKEASYVHAEGFAAGEFRHGSIAMVDSSYAVTGIADTDAMPVVERPMREIRDSGARRVA
ncbi:MAG TPA: SIS domain-containing protein, partial [Candidatus Baltobacteraceae bacterium]|nr:SIS domain-containing protein [Candidatus Baltobacteraceae bacterium]